MRTILLGLIVCLLMVNCQQAQENGETSKDRETQVSDINSLEKQLEADKFKELDESVAENFISGCQQFAIDFPKDTLAPVFLFKAADVSRGIGKYKQAIQLWGSVNRTYPAYSRAPEALFLQAFTFEKELNDPQRAVTYYEYFLEKYDNHPLRKDVSLLIEMIKSNKSAEDLVDEFEKNNKPN